MGCVQKPVMRQKTLTPTPLPVRWARGFSRVQGGVPFSPCVGRRAGDEGDARAGARLLDATANMRRGLTAAASALQWRTALRPFRSAGGVSDRAAGGRRWIVSSLTRWPSRWPAGRRDARSPSCCSAAHSPVRLPRARSGPVRRNGTNGTYACVALWPVGTTARPKKAPTTAGNIVAPARVASVCPRGAATNDDGDGTLLVEIADRPTRGTMGTSPTFLPELAPIANENSSVGRARPRHG
jgi:hypothetical protein